MRFIAFDVKTIGLMPRSQQDLDFAFTPGAGRGIRSAAEVYFLLFDGLPGVTAFVPKGVYETCWISAHGDGVLPLLARVPPWCFPFMVSDCDLASAIKSLLDAANGQARCWSNPSLLIDLGCWAWQVVSIGVSQARLCTRPSSDANLGALRAIEEIWEQTLLQRGGVTFHLNDVAPLFCDFLLEIDGCSRPQRIEHKLGTTIRCRPNETISQRSPFAAARVWHFLIIQPYTRSRLYCIGRHEVHRGWEDHNSTAFAILSRRSYAADPAGFEDMLEFMRSNSRAAMAAADEASHSPDDPSGIPLAACVGERRLEDSVVAIAEVLEPDEEEGGNLSGLSDAELNESFSARAQHARGLPWLCQQLNEQCRRKGKHFICLPLDPGHPFGNHIFVEYDWSSTRESERAVPVYPASPELRLCRCIVLRFLDLCTSATHANHTAPLHIRPGFWTKLACEQHFVIIGSTLSKSICRNPTEAPMPYLVLPSEELSLFHKDNVMSPQDGSHDGSGYFSDFAVSDNVAENPYFPGTHAKPLSKGSKWMSHRNVDPVSYILDLSSGAVYNALCGFFDTQSSVCIQSSSSARPNRRFVTAPYLLTVSQVHQAALKYNREIMSGDFATIQLITDSPT